MTKLVFLLFVCLNINAWALELSDEITVEFDPEIVEKLNVGFDQNRPSIVATKLDMSKGSIRVAQADLVEPGELPEPDETGDEGEVDLDWDPDDWRHDRPSNLGAELVWQVGFGSPTGAQLGVNLILGEEEYGGDNIEGLSLQAHAGVFGGKLSLGYQNYISEYSSWMVAFPSHLSVVASAYRAWPLIESEIIGFDPDTWYAGPEAEFSLLFLTGRLGILCSVAGESYKENGTKCQVSATGGLTF